MLFFFKARVEHKDLSIEDLWNIWEKETKVALEGIEAGKIAALYKVSGQRRVLGILDLESHEELDQILMAGLPMAHYLEFEEIVPIRTYEGFAEDIRRRWK